MLPHWQIHKSVVIEVVSLFREGETFFEKLHFLSKNYRDYKKVNYLELIYFEEKLFKYKS